MALKYNAKQRRKLAPQALDFVEHFARTGDPLYAAALAGYSSPAQRGNELSRDPRVIAQVDYLREARDYVNEALPLVVQEHKKRLLNPQTTNREFAQLAGPFYKISGIRPPEGQQLEKEPHEMSAQEIANKLDELAAEAGNRARLVAVQAEPETSLFD